MRHNHFMQKTYLGKSWKDFLIFLLVRKRHAKTALGYTRTPGSPLKVIDITLYV